MCFTKQPGGLEYSRVKRHLGLVRYAIPFPSITGVVTLRVVTGNPEVGGAELIQEDPGGGLHLQTDFGPGQA